MVINISSYLLPTTNDLLYSHIPSNLRHVIHPISRRATWSWKPLRNCAMRGVTTHISTLKRKTYWTTDLKKNMDTRSLTPFLLMIFVILLQTARDFVRLRITSGQSS